MVQYIVGKDYFMHYYISIFLFTCAHSLVWGAAKAPNPMGQLTAPSEQAQLLAAQNALLRKQVAHVVAQSSVAAKTKQDAQALAVAKKIVGAHAKAQADNARPLQTLLNLPAYYACLSGGIEWNSSDPGDWYCKYGTSFPGNTGHFRLVTEEEINKLYKHFYKKTGCIYHNDKVNELVCWNYLYSPGNYRVMGYVKYPNHPNWSHSWISRPELNGRDECEKCYNGK